MATPFGTEAEAGGISGRVIAMAAGAVVLVLLVVGIATIRRAPANPNAALPADSYAGQLSLGDLSLSEATNGTGGKVTYVDGTVRNTGTGTLTAATVQVTFMSEDGTPPQRQTMPLTLVRTRQPYVDLEAVGAEPVGPGQSREFRLIFETVPVGWNTQPPEMRLVGSQVR